MNRTLLLPALMLGACPLTPPAHAEAAADAGPIVVTGERGAPPQTATRAGTDAARIATTVNAVSVEDTLKYLPGLIVRKRHIGDNFAPIATRTSGLGASARSLIYADGALLSALIANNNGNGSPRWTLVTPGEIEKIDVLYGPFSAAYPGNSIGTVVEMTTRMPTGPEARASALANVQTFDLYNTHRTLPTSQFSASLGDRFGNLAGALTVTRTDAKSQPVSFITAASQPAGTGGGLPYRSKLGAPLRLLGAGGLEHHVQTTYKGKLAWDVTPAVRLAYTLGVWTDDTSGDVESYETGAAGATSWLTGPAGSTAAFDAAVYARDARHWSHALSLTGKGAALDWQVIATLYRYGRDWQLNPTGALPAAFAGGAGTIQKQDGTGWATLDARATWRAGPMQTISAGLHGDRETLNAETDSIANWRDAGSALGAVQSRSHGRTRTLAIWAQDALSLAPDWTLTLGGRQEWWRAWDGINANSKATLFQPERRFSGFSPKASIEWRPAPGWSARLSAGQAWRMPTVGELYQTTTVGTLLANPNPGLNPERARSLELAVEKRDSHGSLRLSLFNEVVDGALISQVGGATTFVQNVDRTRARGMEAALDRRDLIPGIDLAASVTYADAVTAKDAAFPAAVGHLLPSVPHWKGNAVLTWRPGPRVALTAAARIASRMYANLANDDTAGDVYQGFGRYLVVDLRAQFRVTQAFTFALGVDNLNNDRYFLFHPFPQRSFTASIDWKL